MPKNNCPSDDYDFDLAFLLDELIKENNLQRALQTLQEVHDTFSRYNEYMEKIGLLLK